MTTIAIQGIRGAFHEEAAIQWSKDNVQIVPTLYFDKLVDKVADEQCDFGVIAIENTLSGTIQQNLKLIADGNVHICGEINLRIIQNLGVLPGTDINTLTEVRSHYMAINQCRTYFRKYPAISLVNDTDTALSARDIAEQKLKTIGAIASKRAMELYGLETIAASIETNKKNYTRFFVIKSGKSYSESEPFNKATITFQLPHQAGSLSCVLALFAEHQINLQKIESIPIIGQPYHYQFVAEMELDDHNVFKSMLSQLSIETETFQVLGTYIKHESVTYEAS